MKITTHWLTVAAILSLAGTSANASPAGTHARPASPPPQSSSAAPAPAAPKPASTKKKKTTKKRRTKREPTQKAPTPERISEIQTSLSRGGYYQGDPNGKWDANTIAAMQKFQSANGLEPTGKLDALSLQKLGLGSNVAGVSAPKPPAPPACCSAPPVGTPPAGSTQTAPSASPGCCSTPPPSSSSASGAASDPKPQPPTPNPPKL
ncbi:MAG: peptidoglycan-binding domain-containing protein [Candidatus Acidiferrales bacterium]